MDLDITSNKLYIANTGSSGGETNTIWVFDNVTNSVSNVITVGAQPSTIYIDRTLRKAIVVNYSSNTINIIDLDSDSVIATINGNPTYRTQDAILDNINNKIFIAEGINELVVRDYTTTSILTTISGSFSPNGSMEINTHSNKLYVANVYSNILHIINTSNNSVIETLNLPANEYIVDIKSNATNDLTYVATVNDDWITSGVTLKVTLINTNDTIGSSITVVSSQLNGNIEHISIDINNQTGDVYISGAARNISKGNSLYKINSSLTNISSLYYGDGEIIDLKFNPSNSFLYILVDDLYVYYINKISQ